MKNKITEEWFERGKHDFETAKLIFRQKGYYDVIILLLQQAIEKYIKGYLIFHGWELKKIHDIETLLTEVIQFDKTFEDYLDFGRRLTAYYYESRYPPEPVP
ncbi:MAG: HEPN domain-containing protein [Candidatus Humimicrobiaceae bacterium]